jgi:hypothetical protein
MRCRAGSRGCPQAEEPRGRREGVVALLGLQDSRPEMFPYVFRQKRTGLLGLLRDQVEDEANAAGQGIFLGDRGELRLERGVDGDEDAAAKVGVVAGGRGRGRVGGEGGRGEDVEEEAGGGRRGRGRRGAAEGVGGGGGDGDAEGIGEVGEPVRREGRPGDGPVWEGGLGHGAKKRRGGGRTGGQVVAGGGVRRSTRCVPSVRPSFSRLRFLLKVASLLRPLSSLLSMDQHPMQEDSSIAAPTYGFYPAEQDPSSYSLAAYNGHMPPYHVVHPHPPQRVFLHSPTRALDLIIFSFIQASSSSSQTCSPQGCIPTPLFL